MFKSLDTLVAFATIMLMLSMAVTVITQAVTGVVNSRGRHLKRGIQDLLRLLDPKLPAAMSNAIANAVLSHPLISGSSWLTPRGGGGMEGRLASIGRWVLGPRLGTVILREEFTKILMHFASADGAADVSPEISQHLKAALAANGIADPGQMLSNIRARVLEIERFQPELGHAARQSTAVLREAATEYVAKINSSFDQTMDRVSQRFTASTRVVTIAGAVVVAVAFQVDAITIVNRLSADEKMREAFVSKGSAAYGELQKAESGGTPAAALSDVAIEQEYRSFLAENGVISMPGTGEWKQRWNSVNRSGVALTVLLLSLGAPFWYKALGQFLNLRSLLASKDDSQRAARQTGPPPAATGGTLVPGASNDAGDPTALG